MTRMPSISSSLAAPGACGARTCVLKYFAISLASSKINCGISSSPGQRGNVEANINRFFFKGWLSSLIVKSTSLSVASLRVRVNLQRGNPSGRYETSGFTPSGHESSGTISRPRLKSDGVLFFLGLILPMTGEAVGAWAEILAVK